MESMQYSYLSALCTSKRVDARVRMQTFGLLYMGKYELVYRALHRNRRFESIVVFFTTAPDEI